MTESARTPGTRKSSGSTKSVETTSTLAKNTMTPRGTARVTIAFSPRRSCRSSSARACAAIAREVTRPPGVASAVIWRNTSSSERRPACNAAQRRRCGRAGSTRDRRCSCRRSRRPHDVLPRRSSTTAPAAPPIAAESAYHVEAGLGGEPHFVRDRVTGELGRRAERRQPAAGDDRDAVAELLGFVHAVGREHHGRAAGRRWCATSCHVVARACGSIPAVGSSRNSTSGLPITAHASERRCC